MIYIYTIAGMTCDDCHLKQVGIRITDKGIEISKDNDYSFLVNPFLVISPQPLVPIIFSL